MKQLFIYGFASVLLTVFTVQSTSAQAKVFGIVKSDDDNIIAGSNVLLLNENDSILIKGAITDPSGKFNFENIPAGSYIINASFIGYKNYYS